MRSLAECGTKRARRIERVCEKRRGRGKKSTLDSAQRALIS
jgi:hypothetical protein